MRIVQVCPYSWAARGGVQTHVRHLARQLNARGHEVLVVAAGPVRRPVVDPAAGPGDDTDRPSVVTIGRSTSIPFNGSIAPVCVDPRCAPAVRRTLRAFQPDVVHVHEPFVPGISLAAVWFSTAPVVATFHAYCPRSVDAWLCRLATRGFWPIGRRIAARLSVSRAAASSALPAGGAPRVVPNGVDIDTFARAEPAPLRAGRILLFVGRLDRRKGFDVAVHAFARLCERYGDLSLHVVGTGPCGPEVERVPASVRQRVVMFGDVEDARLPSIYASADVFIAPATGGESFGVVLLEAMASGRPIVAADIGGYREVVRPNVDALLVRPGDPAGMADATARLLDDSRLATRLVRAARERVQQFGWSIVTDAIEATYRDVVRARAVRSGDLRRPREVPARNVARGLAK